MCFCKLLGGGCVFSFFCYVVAERMTGEHAPSARSSSWGLVHGQQTPALCGAQKALPKLPGS